MKRSDIKIVIEAIQDAIHAMQNARSATAEAELSAKDSAKLATIKPLAERAENAHAEAVTAANELLARLTKAEVTSVTSAVTIALKKVQNATDFAQKLKLDASQGDQNAATPDPIKQLATNTVTADNEAIQRLNDLDGKFKWSPEYAQADAAPWYERIPLVEVGKWIAGAAVLLIAGLLVWLIWTAIHGDGKFLENLARIEFARGLITFLLSLGTIVIALLLVVGMLLSDGKEESDKKFTRAKEVLTVLVGIFGTILGFYFGTTNSSTAPPALSLSPLAIARSGDGSSTTIAGNISGGKPPYTYGLMFRNEEIPAIKDQPSKDGLFTVTITNAPAGKSVAYTIIIKDSSTNRHAYSATEEQFIKGK